MHTPEASPRGYVEDAFEARTKLADLFSILLSLAQSTAPLIRRPRLLHRG